MPHWLEKGKEQVVVQVPLLQDGIAFESEVLQLLPHAPQLCRSEVVFTQEVPHRA